MLNLLGDYLTRCLFSKVWTLREAALTKTHLLILSRLEREPGIAQCLGTLLSVVRLGVEDKMQQVLFGGISLLENTIAASRRYACLEYMYTFSHIQVILLTHLYLSSFIHTCIDITERMSLGQSSRL